MTRAGLKSYAACTSHSPFTSAANVLQYVGYTEVKRQWESVYTDSAGHVHHRRAAGDGHDNMWSKLTEFTLSIPFIVGFKSNLTARLLALVLILEAMVSWLWFLSPVCATHIYKTMHMCDGLFTLVLLLIISL